MGAGYVGSSTMAVIAHKCSNVRITIVDVDKDKIASWNSRNLSSLPIYEPGLLEIIKNVRNKRLFFSTNIGRAIKKSNMIFISVNTPTKQYGVGVGCAANLTYIESCVRKIAKESNGNKIIIEKSTIPVKTAKIIDNILKKTNCSHCFQILSNPEFLSEGTAIQNLIKPDRILIGGNNSTKAGCEAIDTLVRLYSQWVSKDKILTTNTWSAELSKLTANAFLAQRISSINSISALCEKTGADVDEVACAIGMDNRIGPKFLKSSVGFGGSCFEKDILSLAYLCEYFGLIEIAEYWKSIISINNYQKFRFARRILKEMFYSLNGKRIAIYGFAFKKDTDDTRCSPAISICRLLLKEKANLSIYDPKVSSGRIYEDLGVSNDSNRVKVFMTPEETAESSHAIAVLTEWDEFKSFNYENIYKLMKKPAFIFDGRNILNLQKLRKIGFECVGIGKNYF